MARLAERIPPGATVLELGPASGYFTQHLQENLQCIVDAVEIDPVMAEAARLWCRTMIVGNLETLDLPALLPARAYDVVLMADVLEHLHDPTSLLQHLHTLLKPQGCCLISVPNVAYGGLIASLLGGEFEYRAEGLLDQTHLRFYTRRSLGQLLERAGWFPCLWQPVALSFWDSEFRTRLETLPSAMTDLLASRPELSCYQWLVEARAEAPAQTIAPPLPDGWPGERFPVRLFWSDATQPFDYVRSQILWGQIGALRKVEEFVLDDAANATRLRLRLADRPGFIRLYEIELRDADQKTLWQWTATDGVATLSRAFSGLSPINAEDHALILLNEEESWLDLAWQGLASSPAHTLRLVFGWPESADFVAARSGWEAAVLPLHSELQAVKTLLDTRDQELQAVKTLVGIRDHELDTRDQLIQVQGEHLDAQNRRLVAQEECLRTLHGELDTVKALVGTRDHELATRDQLVQAQGEHLDAQNRRLVAQEERLHALRGELDTVKALVGTRDQELATRDQLIQAQEAHLHALRGELDTVKALVGTRDHELATRDQLIQGQEAHLHTLRGELDTVKALVGTRDQELATRDERIQAQVEHLDAQNQRLVAQEEQGQAQSAEISVLRQSLEQRWAQIATLQNQVAQMQTFSGWIKQPLRPLLKLIRH